MEYNTEEKHTCPQCLVPKLKTRDFWHWKSQDKGTLNTTCIECIRAGALVWRDKNKDEINQKAREYYSDPINRLVRDGQNYRSYLNHKDEHSEQRREAVRDKVEQYRNTLYDEKEEIRQLHTMDITGQKKKRGEHKKECCYCRNVYGLSDFHLSRTTPDGHSYECRYCKAEKDEYRRR